MIGILLLYAEESKRRSIQEQRRHYEQRLARAKRVQAQTIRNLVSKLIKRLVRKK